MPYSICERTHLKAPLAVLWHTPTSPTALYFSRRALDRARSRRDESPPSLSPVFVSSSIILHFPRRGLRPVLNRPTCFFFFSLFSLLHRMAVITRLLSHLALRVSSQGGDDDFYVYSPSCLLFDAEQSKQYKDRKCFLFFHARRYTFAFSASFFLVFSLGN